MSMNKVTLFSNGIGHFTRYYMVDPNEQTKISIPFRRDHISDVATSLNVFGQVKYDVPPTFTPVNAEATSLTIDEDNALRSLVKNLSGAEVALTLMGQPAVSKYTLLGLEQIEVCGAGQQTHREEMIVVMNDAGEIGQFSLTDIRRLKFVNPVVQAEINKALKANFQKIKPDSTFLELVLSTVSGKEEEIFVTYTIPVAAWKMRYSIREEGTQFSMEGCAIVDNNTDEDWDNFLISVVTGNPVSFATDIANIIVPSRKFVNIVDREALGNVMVETANSRSLELARFRKASNATPQTIMACNYTQSYANFGMEDAEMPDAENGTLGVADLAVSEGMDNKEIGDFCVFESKTPISISSKKSAIVPMFLRPLTKGVMLLYKYSNSSRRPFRTIKFKNETDFSLGRGKMVVYKDGVFSGECILEAAKPGDNRMLAHCLENSVKITKDIDDTKHTTSAIRIADEVLVKENVQTCTTTYTIDNKKDEQIKIALEHDRVLDKQAHIRYIADGVDLEQEIDKLTNGVRVYFTMAPNDKATLKVVERHVLTNQMTIGDVNNDNQILHWLQCSIVETGHKLSKNPAIMDCIGVQRQIEETNQMIQTFARNKQELEEQCVRVRANIAAAGSAAVANWVEDLSVAEREIRRITKEAVPAEQKKMQTLRKELHQKLCALTVTWKEEPGFTIVEE